VYFGLAAGPGFLILGKFDPVFGTAGDNMPGIYGGDIAGDYELDERIGAAVSLPFEALGGEHTLSIATFVADTTALSGSLFTRRERLHRSDGGVSNTGRPESLAVALGGGFGGTGYNLGIRYQGVEGEDTAAEYGAVAGLAHEFEAGPAEIALFGEGAWFPDYDGATERAWFLTTGAEAGIGDFALSGVLGLGDTGAGPADRLATTTLEYVIADGLTASIGYRYLREDGVKSHTAGALLTWDFSLE